MGLITVNNADLRGIGPVVDLRLAPCRAALQSMERKRQTLPEPMDLKALVDTGASRSIIQESLVQTMRIFPVGIARMSTTLKRQTLAYEYYLDVELGTIHFTSVFIGAPLPDSTVQVLLGRDFLSHGVFHYDGKTSSFTLEL